MTQIEPQYKVCLAHRQGPMPIDAVCEECEVIRKIVKEEVEKEINNIISHIQNRFAAKEASVNGSC
jgi:hypothetical protein